MMRHVRSAIVGEVHQLETTQNHTHQTVLNIVELAKQSKQQIDAASEHCQQAQKLTQTTQDELRRFVR